MAGGAVRQQGEGCAPAGGLSLHQAKQRDATEGQKTVAYNLQPHWVHPFFTYSCRGFCSSFCSLFPLHGILQLRLTEDSCSDAWNYGGDFTKSLLFSIFQVETNAMRSSEAPFIISLFLISIVIYNFAQLGHSF